MKIVKIIRVSKLISKLISFVDQGFVSLGNFLTIMLCAKFLQLNVQGNFIIAYSIYIGALVFSIAAVYSAFPILYSKSRQSQLYFFTIFIFHSFITILLVISFNLIYFILSVYFVLPFTSYEVFLFTLFIFFQQFADFARRTAYVNSPNIAVFYSFLTYVPRVFILFLFKPNLLYEIFLILSITGIVPFLLLLSKFIQLNHSHQGTFDMNLFKEHWKFSKHLIQVFPISWLTAYLPIFTLGIYHNSSSVAVIGTLKNITNVANVLVEIIEVSYIGQWYQSYIMKGKVALKKQITSMAISFSIFWFLCSLVFYFGYDLIVCWLGQEYKNYLYIMLVLWIAYLIYFLSRIIVLYYRTLSITILEKEFGIISLIVAILSILIIKIYGIDGAIIAYILIPLAPIVYWVLVKRTNE